MLLHVNQTILRGSRERQLVVALIGRAEELIDKMHGMALLKAGDKAVDEFLIIRWSESWRPKVDKAALGWSGRCVRGDCRGIGRQWCLGSRRRGCVTTDWHFTAYERQAQNGAKSDKRSMHSSHLGAFSLCEGA